MFLAPILAAKRRPQIAVGASPQNGRPKEDPSHEVATAGGGWAWGFGVIGVGKTHVSNNIGRRRFVHPPRTRSADAWTGATGRRRPMGPMGRRRPMGLLGSGRRARNVSVHARLVLARMGPTNVTVHGFRMPRLRVSCLHVRRRGQTVVCR